MAAADLGLLGEAVRAARRQAGLTQAQLGEPLLSKSFVSQMEHGAVAPSIPSLFHIARRLDVSAVQLVALADGRLRAHVLLTMAEAALFLDGPEAADGWLASLPIPSPAGEQDPRHQVQLRRGDGLRHLLAGRAHRAAEELQRALDLAPSGSSDALLTRYWLGVAHQAAQRPLAAAEAWQAVAAALPRPHPVQTGTGPGSRGPHPVPVPGPSVHACLRTATWRRLAGLFQVLGDVQAAARAQEEAAAEPAVLAVLEAGAAAARLLWLTALEAYHRADLPGAAALAALVPLLASATRWAPAPPAPA